MRAVKDKKLTCCKFGCTFVEVTYSCNDNTQSCFNVELFNIFNDKYMQNHIFNDYNREENSNLSSLLSK
jgi:hypothetical protein